MHIALDRRNKQNTGICRYVDNLKFHLAQDIKFLKISDFVGLSFINRSKLQKKDLFFDFVYEYFFMNGDLKNICCDVFHCTKNFGVPSKSDISIVTTIHDLIPLILADDYANTLLRRYYFNMVYNCSLKNSNAVIAISRFTLDQIYKLFPKQKHKLVYIPQGCNQEICELISDSESKKIIRELGINKEYIFAMGGAEPRKNLQMLIDIFDHNPEALPLDLVIIGGDWGGRSLRMPQRRISAFHRFDCLNEAQLVSAYKNCQAFVFPSLYEGFGLPILEAMACGCPVLAHNGTSIPEVAGDSAMLVNMRNPEECFVGLKKILYDRSLRADCIAAGLARVKLFSWEKTAAQTLDVYKSVL